MSDKQEIVNKILELVSRDLNLAAHVAGELLEHIEELADDNGEDVTISNDYITLNYTSVAWESSSSCEWESSETTGGYWNLS